MKEIYNHLQTAVK